MASRWWSGGVVVLAVESKRWWWLRAASSRPTLHKRINTRRTRRTSRALARWPWWWWRRASRSRVLQLAPICRTMCQGSGQSPATIHTQRQSLRCDPLPPHADHPLACCYVQVLLLSIHTVIEIDDLAVHTSSGPRGVGVAEAVSPCLDRRRMDQCLVVLMLARPRCQGCRPTWPLSGIGGTSFHPSPVMSRGTVDGCCLPHVGGNVQSSLAHRRLAPRVGLVVVVAVLGTGPATLGAAAW